VITVRRVTGLSDLWTFINLPWKLYRTDPAWVPPLRLERLLHLSRHNPYFEHSDACCWMAWHDKRPLGRISAQIDRLERTPGTGHFGFLEAIDDAEVFSALLGVAEKWLHSRGIRQVTGPFNFSINQECGLLIDGFQSPPVVMMPHNREYYSRRLEEAGYTKAKDLLAYWINPDFERPRVMRGILQRFQDTIRLRTLNYARFKDELAILRELFNDAWSHNWGFVPFTDREFDELGSLLKWLVGRDLLWIAEFEDRPAAFIAEIPNINEAARDLNGRLLPLGWWRLLQRIRRNRVTTGRVPLMGVRRQYQNTLSGAALAYRLIGALQGASVDRGIVGIELSWILEDNKGMDTILQSIGSHVYKRYRVYQKNLDLQQTNEH